MAFTNTPKEPATESRSGKWPYFGRNAHTQVIGGVKKSVIGRMQLAMALPARGRACPGLDPGVGERGTRSSKTRPCARLSIAKGIGQDLWAWMPPHPRPLPQAGEGVKAKPPARRVLWHENGLQDPSGGQFAYFPTHQGSICTQPASSHSSRSARA